MSKGFSRCAYPLQKRTSAFVDKLLGNSVENNGGSERAGVSGMDITWSPTGVGLPASFLTSGSLPRTVPPIVHVYRCRLHSSVRVGGETTHQL